MKYSPKYYPGVGCTHRENIKSGWAHMNLAAVTTWEIGAGAQHTALDSLWGVGTGERLLGLRSNSIV